MFNHPFFYRKKLFKLLDLYGALIRDGKARTFQSAIKMVRRQGDEPNSLKAYIHEIEMALISGETLEVSLSVSLPSIQEKDIRKYFKETEYIANSSADTWQYSNFVNKNQDWGNESEPGEITQILDSKICQLCIKIMIRAQQEKAEATIIDLKLETEYYASEIHMIVEGIKRKVFDLPASLIQPVLNTFLGIADIPYWKEGEKRGGFTLLADGENLSGEVYAKHKSNELWINMDPKKST